MSKSLRLAGALAVAVGLAAGTAGPAAAQGGVQVGTLTCNASGAWGFIFGSTRDLSCTFSAPGRVEYYRGQISRFGVDIGYTTGGVLIWTVVAPTAMLRPGDLAGNYGGGSANVTIGIGVGANALVGGSNNTITCSRLAWKQTAASTWPAGSLR